MANYKNYSLSQSKGKFYLKEKTATEGYEEVKYGTNNENTTYHKYVDTVKGILKYFDVKEAEFQGKKLSFLEVTFIDGDDNNKISVPLKNVKGNYTDEVKALVSALNSADVGEEYTITPRKSTTTGKNGKEYNNINIYLNYTNRKNEEGKGLSTGFISFNDIPKPDKDEDVDLGTTYDFKPVNKFYAQKIKEIKAKFENAPSTSSSNNTPPSAPKVDETKGVAAQYETDNLPF